jgi:hypothetical protein
MKRKILFRGKPKIDGDWFYGNLIDSGLVKNKTYYILPEDADNYDEYEEVIPESIGQFTGVRDVNDVSIFEGDIVEDTGGNTGDVIWNKDDCSFNIYWKNDDLCTNLYLDNGQFYKVIGNIHDNA